MIPLVMGGHGHDGPCAVTGEDIVGDPDGDHCPVDRIDRTDAGRHAGFFLGEIGALQIALG